MWGVWWCYMLSAQLPLKCCYWSFKPFVVTGFIASSVGWFGFLFCSATCPLMLPLFGCCFSWSHYPYPIQHYTATYTSQFRDEALARWSDPFPSLTPLWMVGRQSRENGTTFRLKQPLTTFSTRPQMMVLVLDYWQFLLLSQVHGFIGTPTWCICPYLCCSSVRSSRLCSSWLLSIVMLQYVVWVSMVFRVKEACSLRFHRYAALNDVIHWSLCRYLPAWSPQVFQGRMVSILMVLPYSPGSVVDPWFGTSQFWTLWLLPTSQQSVAVSSTGSVAALANHINNYAEAGIRIVKDLLFSQVRAYNVIQMFSSVTECLNYISEGSVSHINGVWPSFLNFS